MTQYLILAQILDPELFTRYLKGHLPTIAACGGRIVFRSTENRTVLGGEEWDVVVLQEWPDAATFERWWNSEAYRPWAEIRDRAARMTIVRCGENLVG